MGPQQMRVERSLLPILASCLPTTADWEEQEILNGVFDAGFAAGGSLAP